MPRVAVYEGGNIAREGTTGARVQAPNYAESGLATGLRIVGKAGSEYVEAEDQIEEIYDRQDADKLALEHSEFLRQQRQRVRTSRGGDALGTAESARADLATQTSELAARARSPRARKFLEADILSRNIAEADAWDTHAHGEFVKDRQATLDAKIDSLREEAADADDDETAEGFIAQAASVAEERARFDGHSDPDLIARHRAEATSKAYVGRAYRLHQSDQPEAAWAYLDAHKGQILDEDERVLRNALKGELDDMQSASDAAAAQGFATPAAEAPPGETQFLPPIRVPTTTVPGGVYGAPRNYGGHAGRDYAAAAGTPVYPMSAGRIKKVYKSEGGGNTVEVELAGGWTMRVLHLQDGSTSHLQVGQEVGVNDQIGGIGNTGTASRGNHAHVEVYKPNGERVDPAKAIGERVTSPPPNGRVVDVQGAYAYIDKRVASGEWTRARGERAKREVQQDASINDQVRGRAEEEAGRVVDAQLAEMVGRGEEPTSFKGFDANAVARLSPSKRLQYEGMFAENRKPKAIAANGEVAMTLTVMSHADPEKFKRENLLVYRNQLTAAEFEGLAVAQAKMRAEKAAGPTANLRNEIASTISFYAPDIGWTAADGFDKKKGVSPEERQQYLRIFNGMQRHIDAITEGKRAPTDAEMKAAFDRATLAVTSGGKSMRTYQLPADAPRIVDVPLSVINRITGAFRQVNGRDPTPQEVQRLYMDNLGRPGYW